MSVNALNKENYLLKKKVFKSLGVFAKTVSNLSESSTVILPLLQKEIPSSDKFVIVPDVASVITSCRNCDERSLIDRNSLSGPLFSPFINVLFRISVLRSL